MTRPGPASGPGEQGYALIAAVAAIAVFGALALAIATATRISIAAGTGEAARARAEAAAAAGLAIAAQGLAAGSDQMLDLIDGRIRQIEFAGSKLTIRVTDERGKIPLNHSDEDVLGRMLEQAGLGGDELEIARDSLLDWLDEDDQPRRNGAEIAYYAAQGISPRNGGLLSIGELARIRGIGPRLAAQLRPYVTIDPDGQPFDPTYAQPQALTAMTAGGDLSPAALNRERQLAGDRVALDTTPLKAVKQRPLTVAVDAIAPGGGRAHREAVIVVTGKPDEPYAVHEVH